MSRSSSLRPRARCWCQKRFFSIVSHGHTAAWCGAGQSSACTVARYFREQQVLFCAQLFSQPLEDDVTLRRTMKYEIQLPSLCGKPGSRRWNSSPQLQPLDGEAFDYKSANKDDE